MKLETWLNNLKYLVTNRTTHYNNHMPYNCGYVNSDGSISFDCIGLVKSVINQPDIVYRSNPQGWYVTPGQVIPDVDEISILNLCSGKTWGAFQNIVPGEYLYMGGHAGVYVGDLFGAGSGVNVIECTVCWGVEGVVASWIDLDTGARRDQKGGTHIETWEAHGKLSGYIDYSTEPVAKWTKKQAWTLADQNGKELTGWQKVNGKWYSIDGYGYMRNGWYYDPTIPGWFLLSDPSDGHMLTGWQKKGSSWYYLQTSNDGTHVTGVMRTGWLQDNGKWYYLDLQSGAMYCNGTYKIDGKSYTFDATGALIS